MTTIHDLVGFLNAHKSARVLVLGSATRPISRAVPISEARPGDVTFCGTTAKNPLELLGATQASLVIIDEAVVNQLPADFPLKAEVLVPSGNARLDFIRLVERFFAPPRPRGIHPSAVVSPHARLGQNVFIGPLSTIGDHVEIGDGTVIHAGAHIYSNVRIGSNVTIHAGTVIGADGFGYERNEAGELEPFPHVGMVVIEDNVEIGANTCIDRASLGATRIQEGARIDNLVHIAHNVVVGHNAAVIAHAMIGGGTRLGTGSWIAPSACLRDRISVGDNAVVGLGSVVTKDVPAETTVAGVPAREMAEYTLIQIGLRSLIKGQSGEKS